MSSNRNNLHNPLPDTHWIKKINKIRADYIKTFNASKSQEPLEDAWTPSQSLTCAHLWNTEEDIADTILVETTTKQEKSAKRRSNIHDATQHAPCITHPFVTQQIVCDEMVNFLCPLCLRPHASEQGSMVRVAFAPSCFLLLCISCKKTQQTERQ